MNVLLDTHMAIWALLDSPRLTEKARDIILEPDNTIYYSTISVWEVLLKHATHPENVELTAGLFATSCQEAGFVPVEIRDNHVIKVDSFPQEVCGHKDPFDRLLLAQAKAENLYLLTNDDKLSKYPVKCVILQ